MLLVKISLFLSTFLFIESFNIKVLTDNFFQNLQSHPLLIGKPLNDVSKQFIETQTKNYLKTITGEEIKPKKKRSLLDKFTKVDTGFYQLQGVITESIVPVRFPEDIVIFELNSQWYAATLESLDLKEKANYLVIFHYQDTFFVEKTRIPVTNGTKLSCFNLRNTTLLAVAEYDFPKINFQDKSGIYQFDGYKLINIQSIDMHYANDIVMWQIHDEIFMSIAQFKSNQTNYELEIPIYKWLGKHFDLVQTIESKGAQKLTPFEINNEIFLAVANSRDNNENSQIYSEIYKFDFHLEKYTLHQRILTKACLDIQVFELTTDYKRKDIFLVVANSYQLDPDGNEDYETDSIIYKFIDDYFIPFQTIQTNGIQQWLPIQTKNYFVLFASYKFDGLKAFQYNGWAFQEISIKLPQLLKTGLKSIRSTNFRNSSIVVANKNNNGKLPNIFSLEFSHKKILSNIYNDMLSWCDQGLKKVQDLTESVVDVVLGKTERGDVEEATEKFEENKIDSKIQSLNSLIDDLQIEIPQEIKAKEIIFNDVMITQNLNATTLNNLETSDFLDNVINIQNGFTLEELNIDSVQTNSLKIKQINSHDVNTILHTYDDLNSKSVEINRTLTVPEITIQGTLNGIIINNETLLQRKGNQKFQFPLTLNTVTVDNLTLQTLNGENFSVTEKNLQYTTINKLETLIVKNLTVGGYINDIDIPTLQKYSLKKSGDQVITNEFLFDVIEGKNLQVFGKISERKLSDLIDINNGVYLINQTVLFPNEVFINNLIVTETLDQIQVNNGKLDLLLRNSLEEQEISGNKSFDDVTIYHAISLQGHINSKNLEKMNPVVSIDEKIFLEGDKTITELVEIENIVNTNDVITPNGYSLIKLNQDGVRLDSSEIKPHLVFVQQLNLDEIFVDNINKKNPRDFVVVGTEETQIIEGVKTFLGDLSISGDTNAIKINNIEVEELENKVLKVEGDQTISGKHRVKHLIADKISSTETIFEKNLKLIKSPINNLTINDNLQTSFVKAEGIFVKGTINNFDFEQIVNDTITKSTDTIITGHKFFKEISVNHLRIENFKIDQIPDEIDEFRLTEPIDIENITIKNLNFNKECNGVSSENFGGINSEIDADYEFDSIIIYGQAHISSNEINNIDIDNLTKNSVKIDEPHEFQNVIFETEILSREVTLDGEIENLDLDNLVLDNEPNLIIFDEKKFKNLTVNGTIYFEKFMNEVNITQFCQFAMEEESQKNLVLNGSAIFVRGPNVGKINGIETKKIKNNAWFSDENTTLTGSIDFEEIIFQNDIQVEGFVDNISLNLLYENYFSKTKPQNITATFTFENSLTIETNLNVPTITINGGNVNGINLDEFVRTVLLDDYDQVFESVAFFENCSIENLTGDFVVNDLDLNNDVVRYDKINMITGPKIFDNLNIKYLKLNKNIKIQNVDILDWFKNSVLKTTGFNITGFKTFNNGIFTKGFQLGGTLNTLKFDSDNILLRNIPQEISGIKIIKTTPQNPVNFKSLKLKGLLNGIDISDLINNQAYKNQPNIFKTTINLNNNITTKNLVIKQLFQGVNVTELITNVTNLGFLNNLLEQYEKLAKMSQKLQKSMDDQAYFLHHYKSIQTIPSATNNKKIICPDGYTRIGILINEESHTKMNLYGWDETSYQFSLNATIHFAKQPRYVDQVLMGRYLYLEGTDGTGNFIEMSNLIETYSNLYTNKTIFTTSFISPITNEACTLFIYRDNFPRIFCETNNKIELKQILSPKAIKASSVIIDGTLYLIILTQPTLEMEAYTDIWRLNKNSYFEPHQSLFEAHSRSISIIFYNKFYYLAIASGHLENAMYSGRVEIYQFDQTTLQFVPWQSLKLDAPIQVEFAILPSQELILYVLTDSPIEPLLVFRYEGIAGFQLKITGSALPQISYMNQFMGASGQHFIVAQSYDEINIIQAIFKGEKEN